MFPSEGLSIANIKAIYIEEIEGVGGKLANCFEDDSWLFIRSVLPRLREVTPRDNVQGGVALRAISQDITVCPYVFRQLCANGAILAHVVDTQQVSQSAALTVAEKESMLRGAIQKSCADQVFAAAIDQLRLARRTPADLGLSLLPHLGELPRELAQRVMDYVSDKWTKGPDRSQYGLMNTITSLARDTADPQQRWALEALGGEIGMPISSRMYDSRPGHVYAARESEVVSPTGVGKHNLSAQFRLTNTLEGDYRKG